MSVIEVKVGIKTDGQPRLYQKEGYTILENMLIGDGFHWQKVITARLPGEVKPLTRNLTSDADKNVTLINTLPLETYLECVVGSEMNPSAPIEFLKAHAIISRNWVIGKVLKLHQNRHEDSLNSQDILIGWDDTAGHSGFDVCSDDHCQRYQGLQEISEEALRAIRETADEVLSDSEGNIIDTRFSKCCGGITEIFSTCWQPVDIPVLESFKDPWCDLSGLDYISQRSLLTSILKDYDRYTEGYGFRWRKEVSKTDIRENLKKFFNRDIGDIVTFNVLHRGPSGRIDKLEIIGTYSRLILGKELWIRRLFSSSHLYSSAFEITDLGDRVILVGRGWGHGVGLCQIGAANMAMQGRDYKNILAFYYPGSRLSQLGN